MAKNHVDKFHKVRIHKEELINANQRYVYFFEKTKIFRATRVNYSKRVYRERYYINPKTISLIHTISPRFSDKTIAQLQKNGLKFFEDKGNQEGVY